MDGNPMIDNYQAQEVNGETSISAPLQENEHEEFVGNEFVPEPILNNGSLDEINIAWEAEEEKEETAPTAQKKGISVIHSRVDASGIVSSSSDLMKEKIDFSKDKERHRTWGRRIATYLSRNYAWYNPQLKQKDKSKQAEEGPDTSNDDNENDEDKPSIEKAWEFFEHVTLNRYIVKENPRCSTKPNESDTIFRKIIYKCFRGDRELEIAGPGECEKFTKLYSPFNTPLSQMADFGLGYGLYFSSVRYLVVLSLLAGIINIPNLLYFSSLEYDATGKPSVNGTLLRASAICTDRKWVPCPTCTSNDFDSPGSYEIIRHLEFLGQVPDGSGDWLNVTDYIYFDYSTSYTFTFSDEGKQALFENYNITLRSDSIQFDDYGTYLCDFGSGCLYEHFNIDCLYGDTCHLYLGNLASLPPYGNSFLYVFAEKTNCNGATRQQGYINLLTVIVLIASGFCIRREQNKILTKFDEDEQTAQDYSINIRNPPDDAHDPQVWKDFFEKNFKNCHVTVCTIDTDNDDILQLLIQRREILKQLEIALRLPKEACNDMKILEQHKMKYEMEKQSFCAGLFSPSIPKLVSRLQEINGEIRALLNEEKELPVTNVFVTFETEASQREVLRYLTVGRLDVINNDTGGVFNDYLFENRVLHIEEPDEPSSIRWQELNATSMEMLWRVTITSAITTLLLFVGISLVMLVYFLDEPFWATVVTTILTNIFPMILKGLTALEYHRSESSRQKWMFIRISIFNVVMTTILLSRITPFQATLDDKQGSAQGLIPAIHGLFYFQIFFSPIIQFLDPVSQIYRHYFAPRAKTQVEMNRCMMGSEIYLAERYANIIKFLFLMMWNSAIFPGAFFMGAAALFLVFYVDRFSLMRSWARTPQVGSEIADFYRNYFVPAAMVCMAVVSAYKWSGFPYDNLCAVDDAVLNPLYAGRNWTFQIEVPDTVFWNQTVNENPDIIIEINVPQNQTVYEFCEQDIRFLEGWAFPPLPKWQGDSQWMTEEQEEMLRVFSWTSVVIVICGIGLTLYRIFSNVILGFFTSTYEATGKDKKINYTDVGRDGTIDTYIPQVTSPYFLYPLLLCDVSKIDPNLVSWRDPDKPHEHYSVYEDIKDIMDWNDVKVKYLFSEVKHWPPPPVQEQISS